MPNDSDLDPANEHRASVERDGPRVSLTIEVPGEIVSREYDAATDALRNRVKLKGFRKGKAPVGMIRQKFDEEIREHVVEQLVPRHISEELEDRDLEPVASPALESVDFLDDGSLRFTARFDVAPELELRRHEGLEVSAPESEVTDDLVDRALADLREQAAELVPADEGATVDDGDYVRARIALFPQGGKGKKLGEEERLVHVGHEEDVPGLNDQLPDLSIGDRREFLTRLGDEYPDDILAGKDVTCRVEVLEIKQLHLPAVDDELAKDFGLEDLEELEQRTRRDLEEHLQETREKEIDERLVARLVEENPFDVPESLVEQRLDEMMKSTARKLEERGVDPSEAVNWKAYRADNRADARRSVAGDLILDKVADVESIEVEDADVLQEIERHEGGHGRPPVASVAQQMKRDGSFESLRRVLRRRRALEWVRHHATIEVDDGSARGGDAESGG